MIPIKGLAAKLIKSSASKIKRLSAGHKTLDLVLQDADCERRWWVSSEVAHIRRECVAKDRGIEAASNSLKKSIREIDDFLDGQSQPLSGGLRADLHDRLADLARSWYAKGFNRGHRESREAFEETGKVPKRLRATVKRKLFIGNKRKVTLSSKL